MAWVAMVRKYLRHFNYTLVEVDDGMVYYKDQNGRIWGARECAVSRNVREWEGE